MEESQLRARVRIERQSVRRTPADAIDEIDLIPVQTYWQQVRRRFFAHRLAVIALFLLGTMVALAVFVPLLTGDAYQKTSLVNINRPPSLAAPLGTDDIGQNIFIRLMKGLQTSLMVGTAAVLIIVVIGVAIGSVAGYLGGWVDNVLMRFVDVMLSLPGLFLIIMITAFFGTGNAAVVIIAIGLTGWTTAARLIRGEFLALRNADYVEAARALGAPARRIILRHMLPGAMAPLVVAAALGIADSVVTEAALSFLGFGILPPEASLGNMLTKALDYFFRNPILVFYPGITLILLVLAASFLGDGLRDALDPRQRVEAK
ncbi:MAG: ABC transporter permease [Chloroflexi bacterium]|nr:ABC transporter permease [Chloroflexota bacterium]